MSAFVAATEILFVVVALFYITPIFFLRVLHVSTTPLHPSCTRPHGLATPPHLPIAASLLLYLPLLYRVRCYSNLPSSLAHLSFTSSVSTSNIAASPSERHTYRLQEPPFCIAASRTASQLFVSVISFLRCRISPLPLHLPPLHSLPLSNPPFCMVTCNIFGSECHNVTIIFAVCRALQTRTPNRTRTLRASRARFATCTAQVRARHMPQSPERPPRQVQPLLPPKWSARSRSADWQKKTKRRAATLRNGFMPAV